MNLLNDIRETSLLASPFHIQHENDTCFTSCYRNNKLLYKLCIIAVTWSAQKAKHSFYRFSIMTKVNSNIIFIIIYTFVNDYMQFLNILFCWFKQDPTIPHYLQIQYPQFKLSSVLWIIWTPNGKSQNQLHLPLCNKIAFSPQNAAISLCKEKQIYCWLFLYFHYVFKGCPQYLHIHMRDGLEKTPPPTWGQCGFCSATSPK